MTWPWDYRDVEAFPYGEERAYAEGMRHLADCATVEDWGCGCAWARRYRDGSYVGVDMAPGYADVIADLVTYRSETDGIFMRGVLEHNSEWRAILDNALASCRRLVLVLFTPMAEETEVLAYEHEVIPVISFAPADIESRFDRDFTFADIETDTQYGVERMYVVG